MGRTNAEREATTKKTSLKLKSELPGKSLSIAEEKGLLAGPRTLVRARMPAELVEEAKRKTGITTDSRLIEAALANVAFADDYMEWLSSQRGTVSPDLDLEF